MDSVMKAKIVGVSAQMRGFDYFYGVVLGELILYHGDNLSRTLQKTDISAAQGQEVAELTIQTLQSIQADDKFQLFWENTRLTTRNLDKSVPELPRHRKTPRRFEPGIGEAEFPASPCVYYRPIYCKALDLIIKNHFEQPGYKVYQHLQEILLKAANQTDYEADFDFVTEFYGTDINRDMLRTELKLYTSMLADSDSPTSQDVFSLMKSLPSAQKSLTSEVGILTKLLLVMPATNAVSERSLSGLHCVKTYLRSAMNQDRLNHLMVLHIHKHLMVA